MPLRWRVGVEVELLAPAGLSRLSLAEQLAAESGGRVRRFFHQQSELSLVPGKPIFDNLTLGFIAEDENGHEVARCVDDVTLCDDLDRERPPAPGWCRVVSDDARWLRLIARFGDPTGTPRDALAPVAARLGLSLEDIEEHGMARLADEIGAPIAIAAPLPGERERPCELVTPPIAEEHGATLDALLRPAQSLGFTPALESATHIHFDAAPLRDARVIQRLVCALIEHGDRLKAQVGVNPRCRRLGPWPVALHQMVTEPGFVDLPWPVAQAKLKTLSLTKYCDFNLVNLIHETPHKHTFEVRVLPGLITAKDVLEAATPFADLLHQAVSAD